jgi:hypothetical protein
MQRKGWALAAALLVAASGCERDRIAPALGTLEVTPMPDFGHVMLGNKASYSLKITNIGRRSVLLDSLRQEEPSLRDFSFDPGGAKSLATDESTVVTFTFSPAVLGQRLSRVVLISDAAVPRLSMDLSGTGILGKADFAPKSLAFGQVGLTSSSTLPVTFTNAADDPAAVQVGAVGGPDAAGFDATPSGAVAVAPQSSLPVHVKFHPWRVGLFKATLPVRPCPSCAWENVTLTGEGIAASLVAAPTPLDFGSTAPQQLVVKTVKITNLGSRTVTLSASAFGGQSSKAFSFQAPLVNGATLPQNQSVVVTIGFSPQEMGAMTGELRVPTDDDGTPVVIVPITGLGVGPSIKVNPEAMGFPRTAVGLTVQKSLSIRNVGLDPTGQHPLIITGYSVTSGADFAVTGPALPLTLAASRGQYLQISYAPVAEGVLEGSLLIQSNDPLRPMLVVPLHGSASKLGDCTYKIVPPSLDFASVAIGSQAQLSFAVRNVGTTDCAVANIRLSANTAPEFAVTNISTRMVAPGEQLLVPVGFSADGAGPFTGEADFTVNSMAAPQGMVPLTGGGVPACFAVVPQPLDFGSVGLMCKSPTLSVALRNMCSVPVDVHRAYVGPAPTDVFSVNPAQAGAQTIQPGGNALLAVTYAPKVVGVDSAPLYVDTSLQASPYLVELDGNALARLTQTDTYVIPPIQKVDVLWMIDNSGSMADKQKNLANNAARFIQHAAASGADYHIAVTTSGLIPYTAGWTQCPGGASGGEAGRFFPVDNSIPRILTNQTPNVEAAFAALAHVGTCHWIETGLEAVRLALTPPLIDSADDAATPQPADGNAGFLRPDARLAVIYVTDEDDIVQSGNTATKVQSPVPVQTYVNQLEGLKPGRPDMVTASAIIGLPGSCGGDIDGVGSRYIQLVQEVGGSIADICGTDWGGVIDTVAKLAFDPQSAFPLSKAPGDRNIAVAVDGNDMPATAPDGTQSWHYDAATGMFGQVVFAPNQVPGPNSTVTITYDLPCPP